MKDGFARHHLSSRVVSSGVLQIFPPPEPTLLHAFALIGK
jgi:hypothetical protein